MGQPEGLICDVSAWFPTVDGNLATTWDFKKKLTVNDGINNQL